MNPKPFLTTVAIATIIFLISLFGKYLTSTKDDVEIKEKNKNIIVKQYNTHVKLAKDYKSFAVRYDSTYYRYKQNEILYDGILTLAQHHPHIVLVKTTKKIKKNNVTYKITKNEHVEEYFSCDQVTEFEKKIGKRIVITKVYYPREKYCYKFP